MLSDGVGSCYFLYIVEERMLHDVAHGEHKSQCGGSFEKGHETPCEADAPCLYYRYFFSQCQDALVEVFAQVFVLLVLMALVTTFMTTPMLSLVEFLFKQHKRSHIRKLREERARNAQAPQQTGKLLLCFGRPDTGRKLLRVYSLLFGPRLGGHPLLAAHYTLGTDVNPANAEQFANESFLPITEEARQKRIDFEKIYRTTDSFINEAKQLIRTEQPDMILLGAGPRFMSSQEMPLRAVTMTTADNTTKAMERILRRPVLRTIF